MLGFATLNGRICWSSTMPNFSPNTPNISVTSSSDNSVNY